MSNLSTKSEPAHLIEVRSSLWVDGGGGAAASASAEIRTWVTEFGPCCLQVWHCSCDSRKVQVTQPSSDSWLAWLVGLHRIKQRISTWETKKISFVHLVLWINMKVLYRLSYFVNFHSIVSIQQNEAAFTCENAIQRISPCGSQRPLAPTTTRSSLLSNTKNSFVRLVMPKFGFYL